MTLDTSGGASGNAQSTTAATATPAPQPDGKALRAAKRATRDADRHGSLGDRPVAGPKMTPGGPERGGAEIAAQAPTPRGQGGRFAPQTRMQSAVKNDLREVGPDRMDLAKRALRGESLEDETDASALDSVRPTGKSGDQKPADSDAETSAATDEAPAETEQRATRSKVKDLENARKALKLEDWTDAELDDLSDDAILKHGRRAKDAQVAKARELRMEADARAKDSGSLKPAATQATKPGAAKTAESDDDDAWFEATAKESFKDFDGGETTEPFVKALSKFSRAATERAMERHSAQIAKAVTEHVAQVVGELRFERAIEALRGDFPDLDVEDGLAEVSKLIPALAKTGDYKDTTSLVRAACNARWGDKRAGGTKAKADKIRAAKDAGSAVAAIHPIDPLKPESIMDMAKRTLREKRSTG